MSSAGEKSREDLLKAASDLVRRIESLPDVVHISFQRSLERANELKKAARHVQLALQLVMKFHPEEAEGQSTASGSAGSPRARPAMDRKDAFKGDTQTIPLPKLLSFLGMQQKTGVLEIQGSGETYNLVFDSGDIVEASSNNPPPGTRVGELLVSMRRIRAEDLDAVLAQHDSSAGRIGLVLEQANLIGSADLCDVLRAQVQEMFTRITGHRAAKFAFFDGLPTIFDRRIRINTNQLLLESARMQDEATTTN